MLRKIALGTLNLPYRRKLLCCISLAHVLIYCRWTVVNLVLAVIAFLIDAVELSMYIHNDLSPKLYLCFNTFKFSIWIIPFAWNIAMDFSAWQERGWDDIYLYVAIGLSSAVL